MPNRVHSLASPGYPGEFRDRTPIVESARLLSLSEGESYAIPRAPVSLYSRLSGNSIPGATRIDWLKGRSKCNQFAGEALIRAGYAMPTFTMSDGTEHFVNAEALPRYTKYFNRVPPVDARPGDLVITDWPGTGENTAHVEIISTLSPQMMTIGARSNGAKERTAASLDRRGKVTILRPKLPAASVAAPHTRK